MDDEFLKERIESTKAQIIAYEDAVTALVGGVESYTLDTGQTKQTVKKHDLSALNKMIDSLMNRLATLQARLTGCGVTNMRPSW